MTNLRALETRVSRLDHQLGALLRNINLIPALNDANAVLVGDGAITEDHLAPDSVTTVAIQALAVTTAKIGNLAVTGAKIADATIGSAKITDLAVDKLTAGAGLITTLTIAAGGRIEDADGSYWDQNVLKLVSAGDVGDAFVLAAGGDDQAYISADSSTNAIFGLDTTSAAEPTSVLLSDGQVILGFEGLGFNTLRPKVIVTTSGVAIGGGNLTPSWGSSQGGIFIGEVLVAPSGTPSGGGVLYVESGSLKFRTSGGNTRTVAAV